MTVRRLLAFVGLVGLAIWGYHDHGTRALWYCLRGERERAWDEAVEDLDSWRSELALRQILLDTIEDPRSLRPGYAWSTHEDEWLLDKLPVAAALTLGHLRFDEGTHEEVLRLIAGESTENRTREALLVSLPDDPGHAGETLGAILDRLGEFYSNPKYCSGVPAIQLAAARAFARRPDLLPQAQDSGLEERYQLVDIVQILRQRRMVEPEVVARFLIQDFLRDLETDGPDDPWPFLDGSPDLDGLGEHVVELVPLLRSWLRSPGTEWPAVVPTSLVFELLESIGPPARDALPELTAWCWLGPSEEVSTLLPQVILSIDPSSTAALEQVVCRNVVRTPHLDHLWIVTDELDRWARVVARAEGDIVPHLVAMLDEGFDRRMMALHALERTGERAAAAAAAVMRVVREPARWEERAKALQVQAAVGGSDPDDVAAWIEIMQSEAGHIDYEARFANDTRWGFLVEEPCLEAARALIARAPDDPRAVAAMLRVLGVPDGEMDRHGELVVAAATLLGRTHLEDPLIDRALEVCMGHYGADEKIAAARAMVARGASPWRTVGPLFTLLRTEHPANEDEYELSETIRDLIGR